MEERRPESVGPYTILDVLGQGGMGVVYLAEQHEPVRRTVALKVLRADKGSDAMVARFQAERQALAVMDHPGIAKVFDAGVTADGHSYFAMERVDGLPLTEYCDSHRLGIRDRVRLFAEICHAVQHAHLKGLIHRDLKPSNVLVSEVDGRPLARIIDFGIAKAVEGDDFLGDQLTRDDQVIGTPAYMSPEQLEGTRDIDTRSDIYALGILLYEVLVGYLPFGPNTYRGWASVVAALHREAPTPSQRLTTVTETEVSEGEVARWRNTTPAALRRALRGDLDFIVSRAMDRDRGQRYETANGLALDLERYLLDQPVRAKAGGTAYLLRKFVRRHRVAVGFVGSLVLGLVIFSTTTAFQAQRIALARDEADQRRVQAENLIDFMLGDLRNSLGPIGRLDIMNNVGDEALAYFRTLPGQNLSDDDLYRRTEALRLIGEVRLNQGDLPGAEESFEESLDPARVLAARDSMNGSWQLGLAFSHFWIGNVRRFQGEAATALEHFEAYRDIAERLVALDPANEEYRTELAYAQNNIGVMREGLGDLEGAAAALDAALASKIALAEADPADPERRADVARGHLAVGVIEDRLGRLEKALGHHEANVTILDQLVRADTANATRRADLVRARSFYGDLLEANGRMDEAYQQLQTAEAQARELVARDPTNTEWRRNHAISRLRVAAQLLYRDRNAEAIAQYRAAAATLEELLGLEQPREGWQDDLIMARIGLARAALRSGDNATALATARRASQAVDSTRVARDRVARAAAGRAALALGDVLKAVGDSEAALTEWGRAEAVLRPLAEDSNDRFVLEPWSESLRRLSRGTEATQRLLDLGLRDPRLLSQIRR